MTCRYTFYSKQSTRLKHLNTLIQPCLHLLLNHIFNTQVLWFSNHLCWFIWLKKPHCYTSREIKQNGVNYMKMHFLFPVCCCREFDGKKRVWQNISFEMGSHHSSFGTGKKEPCQGFVVCSQQYCTPWTTVWISIFGHFGAVMWNEASCLL